jgi:hypothetical protein
MSNNIVESTRLPCRANKSHYSIYLHDNTVQVVMQYYDLTAIQAGATGLELQILALPLNTSDS